MEPVSGNPTREQLARIAGGDQRLIIALERLFQQANQLTPSDLATLQAEIVAAAAAAVAAQAAADAAQALADLLVLPEYLVAALSGTLDNERLLSGDTGVTVDFSTSGTAVISVDVLAILGYTPVDPDSAVTLTAGLTVVGQTETDSLRINQSPTAGAIVPTDYITIDLNGTTYKIAVAL